MVRGAPPGRPRSEQATTTILEATGWLLRQHGWDGLRIADVARLSGSSSATIYRRWKSKEALAAAAMTHVQLMRFESIGDQPENLRGLVESVAEDLDRSRATLAGFLAVAQENEQVGNAMRTAAAELQNQLRSSIGGIVGHDHPLLGLLVDLIPGVLMFRAGMLKEDVTPSSYSHEIDQLLTIVSKRASDEPPPARADAGN